MCSEEDSANYLKTLNLMSSIKPSDYDLEVLYSTFKSLRDLGIKCKQFENDPCYKEESLNYSIQILNELFTNYNERFLPAMGQALQFIHNLTVQNLENQLMVWQMSEKLFKNFMLVENEKNRNYISGTLYNITLGRPQILLDILKDTQLIHCIFDSASKGTDFSILMTESIQNSFSENFSLIIDSYFFSEAPCHLEMLNILYEHIQHNEVDTKLVLWIKETYKDKSNSLVNTKETQASRFEEMYYFVKILVFLSGREKTNTLLQKDVSVLSLTKSMLEKIHIEGRKPGNEFTPTENIMTARTSSENLKTNLIRLIGNLCWRNKTLQDEIRNLDGIPLILDCCIRDGKNPFITESVVFTVRNLCEGNFENQKYIKNMNKITHNEMSERAKDWPSVFLPSS